VALLDSVDHHDVITGFKSIFSECETFNKSVSINPYLTDDLELEVEAITEFRDLFNFQDSWLDLNQEDEVPFLESYEYMVKCNTFDEVFNSYYYQEHFLKRYLMNIPLMAYEVLDTPLTWQQWEICDMHDPYGGRLAVPSGHGCGKTKLIGVLSAHHMLTAQNSITRVQAPKLEQITKLSFGEVVNVVDKMRGNININGKVEPNKWAFLAKFFVFTVTRIYIKSYPTQWYIESAVAKRGESNSLSGQHNWSYLLILDEACGIEDGHIVASLGGLTEEKNSCIAFSQHANTNSMFHLFVTSLSVDNDGVWRVNRLSSYESPLVSDKALANFIATYTDDELRVRVEGLYPLETTGNLFSLEDMKKIYEPDKKWLDGIEWTSRVFTTDIAYKGIRDSSVTIRLNLACVVNELGIMKYFVEVTDIEVFHKATKMRPTEVGEKAIKDMVGEIWEEDGYTYEEYVNGVDASSGGYETFLTMEDAAHSSQEQIEVFGLEWGGNDRLSNIERGMYVNERAKGYVLLKETIDGGRFFINCKNHKTRVLTEMENIPLFRDGKFRYQIASKKDMKSRSPDILDCCAEIFIMPYQDSTSRNAYLLDDKAEIKKKKELIERVMKQREKNEEERGVEESSLDITTIV